MITTLYPKDRVTITIRGSATDVAAVVQRLRISGIVAVIETGDPFNGLSGVWQTLLIDPRPAPRGKAPAPIIPLLPPPAAVAAPALKIASEEAKRYDPAARLVQARQLSEHCQKIA